MAKNIASTTREKLAEDWEVSTRHIDRLIHAGKLEAFKSGRCVRIPLESAREHIEKNLIGGKP